MNFTTISHLSRTAVVIIIIMILVATMASGCFRVLGSDLSAARVVLNEFERLSDELLELSRAPEIIEMKDLEDLSARFESAARKTNEIRDTRVRRGIFESPESKLLFKRLMRFKYSVIDYHSRKDSEGIQSLELQPSNAAEPSGAVP